MLSKENAFKVLTIRKSLNINGEPLSYNVEFGLTESCHQQLLKLSQKNGLNPSELIKKALDCVIFNENYVEVLKSQRKAINVLLHKRTVNLNKTQFDRISELSKTYRIARSEIIRKSKEEFLKKDFLHREGLERDEGVDCLRGMALKTADLIKRSGKTFALTGAGISTESGIPDYRSKGTGLWEKYDPMSKASLSALISDPVEFYNFNLPRWIKYANAEPNTAHRVLAKMEEKNFIRGIITQNIDGLHIKAGSKNVWEVHGHLRTCRCMGCNHKYDFSEAVRQFEDGIVPPKCKTCGGILRPDVVLFEDPMSSDYYRAREALDSCELLMVVGSSLQVYPVADLPYLAKELVIINKEPTPFDSRAAVTAHCKAGEFFEELASILKI